MLRLSPNTLEKVLRMGATVQKFVRGGDAPAAPAPSGNSDRTPPAA